FVPDSTDVNGLRPPTVGELDSLSDVANDPDAGGIDPTTSTTVAGADGSTATTAGGETTTSVAGEAAPTADAETTTTAPGETTTSSTP
nr:hypothetical protein [Acidimicrobiales bacterium]